MTIVLSDTVVLALFGLLGGLVRHIASHQGRIVLPHMDKDENDNPILDMGFLYNVFAGCIAGLLVPYGLGSVLKIVLPEFPQAVNNIVTALLGGYASAHFFEKVLEYMIGKLPEQEPQLGEGIPI